MTKTIAFVVYPGLTPLDLVGPLQVLSALASLDPSYRVVVVGRDLSPVGTDTPLRLAPSHTFAQVTAPDVVLVPGGAAPTMTALTDQHLLDWLRQAATTAETVASVCTGSLLLGAAGLLEGRRATTHWGMRGLLPKFGAIPVAERWVSDGPFLTGAGVSAGIDLALHLVEQLVGAELARTVQLFIEYDPQPPLGGIDWGSVDYPAFEPHARRMLTTGLADHPDLLARLLS
ncbi:MULTISPECIES: DJ-1/PfpI family protein [unclassified Kitasatospora]|uniref:DJ-1/PfpI family protein n=1 Tax=unclassified Kitasatospora TaxID=2633591 RepID=UPI00070B562E|nr:MULTISPECIES: DJ-1/PfpI family protein [unclassified Kitasatospora]KQV23743.1 thiamine biosynthesis protein ThiJ [Kitasatospora sp. Root107]KRB67544.1 thiamine biosynthesis protein ThiJ [Kitasatospora sp. Root187]